MAFQDNNSVNTFFALLRSGLYGTPLPDSELPDSIDWKAISVLAKKHFVIGTIIDSVQHLPPHLQPTDATIAKMKKFALGLIQANLILDKTIARLVDFFKQHDINGVVLKGQGVARYYRSPQMRQSGDIDFYVGTATYKRAVEACKQGLINQSTKWHETDQHFDFYLDNGILIELHRIASRIYSPIKNKRFQDWTIQELEHAPNRRTLTLDNVDVTLPSYDFDAIFIFYHAWRHYIMGGIGLRQLCDWAMIFHYHSADIDTPRLIHNLKRFGMTNGWKLFAGIAVNHLGVAPEKMPLYDPAFDKRSEKILQEIVDGGNFGYFSESYLRTRSLGRGMRYGFMKMRNYTNYFCFLFPLMPIEAIFLYCHRLYYGAISCVKHSIRKSDK